MHGASARSDRLHGLPQSVQVPAARQSTFCLRIRRGDGVCLAPGFGQGLITRCYAVTKYTVSAAQGTETCSQQERQSIGIRDAKPSGQHSRTILQFGRDRCAFDTFPARNPTKR